MLTSPTRLGATVALTLLLADAAPPGARAHPAAPPPPGATSPTRPAGSRGPVFIPPPTSPEGIPADADLVRAFRGAVLLRVPARHDWRLRAPRASACRLGCTVLRIVGHRIPSPEFTLVVERLPARREVGRVALRVPARTSTALLADTLLLKASFLLGVDLDAPPPPPPPPDDASTAPAATPRPPTAAPPATVRRRAAPRSHRTRLELGVGTSAHVGTDGAYQSFGVELSLSVRVWGPWRLRLAGGFQKAAALEDENVVFSVAPVSLLVGAQWSGSWWTLGVYGGGTVLFHFMVFRNGAWQGTGDLRQSALTGGPTAQGRCAIRLARWLDLGLNMSVTVLANAIETDYWSTAWMTERSWSAPKVLLHPSLDLAFRF